MNSKLLLDCLGLLLFFVIIYGGLWRVFSLAGLRGWYALIPVWVFFCWARVVRMKRPIHSCIMTSIFIYGVPYMVPWYMRIFGDPSLESSMANPMQVTTQTILVSKPEFFIFGIFLFSILFGFYQYIRLCWRLTEAFSFRAWLALIMILMPPLSLALGLLVIILSKRPFHALAPQK